MKTHLILIDQGDSEDFELIWPEELIRQFAVLVIADRQVANDHLDDQGNDEIVLGSTSIADAAAAIQTVRTEEPNGTRILVADAHPLWAHARTCFRAGADDYISISAQGPCPPMDPVLATSCR